MRALLHGSDERLEGALAACGLELRRTGEADVFISLCPAPELLPLAELPPERWMARFRAWVEEPFWALQAWLRDVLRRRARGSWVAISSVAATQPFPGAGADGAAAVALQTLVQIAAAEYGAHGIRANAIAAGWRWGDVPAGLDSQLAAADTPTGRLTTAAEIAAATVWLLSEDAEQLNGEVIRLDGGYTLTRGSRLDPRKP